MKACFFHEKAQKEKTFESIFVHKQSSRTSHFGIDRTISSESSPMPYTHKTKFTWDLLVLNCLKKNYHSYQTLVSVCINFVIACMCSQQYDTDMFKEQCIRVSEVD